MIRLDETGVGPGIHVSVLAYEVSLLQEWFESLDKPSGFTTGTIKAVQGYMLDRIEIISNEEGLQNDQER